MATQWIKTAQAQDLVEGATADRMSYTANDRPTFVRATVLEIRPSPSSAGGLVIKWSDGKTLVHQKTDRFVDVEMPPKEV